MRRRPSSRSVAIDLLIDAQEAGLTFNLRDRELVVDGFASAFEKFQESITEQAGQLRSILGARARFRARALREWTSDGTQWIYQGPHPELAEIPDTATERAAHVRRNVPEGGCRWCLGVDMWRVPGGPLVCVRCHPAPQSALAARPPAIPAYRMRACGKDEKKVLQWQYAPGTWAPCPHCGLSFVRHSLVNQQCWFCGGVADPQPKASLPPETRVYPNPAEGQAGRDAEERLRRLREVDIRARCQADHHGHWVEERMLYPQSGARPICLAMHPLPKEALTPANVFRCPTCDMVQDRCPRCHTVQCPYGGVRTEFNPSGIDHRAHHLWCAGQPKPLDHPLAQMVAVALAVEALLLGTAVDK